MLIRDIIERMSHDGCGGRVGRAELPTGIEAASSRPVRRIVLITNPMLRPDTYVGARRRGGLGHIRTPASPTGHLPVSPTGHPAVRRRRERGGAGFGICPPTSTQRSTAPMRPLPAASAIRRNPPVYLPRKSMQKPVVFGMEHSEFERAMIRERTSAGLAAARAEGRIGGLGGRRRKLDVARRARSRKASQRPSAIQTTAIPSDALPTNSNISSGEKGCMNGAARTSRYILASGLAAITRCRPIASWRDRRCRSHRG